jgi:hypothetical protein
MTLEAEKKRFKAGGAVAARVRRMEKIKHWNLCYGSIESCKLPGTSGGYAKTGVRTVQHRGRRGPVSVPPNATAAPMANPEVRIKRRTILNENGDGIQCLRVWYSCICLDAGIVKALSDRNLHTDNVAATYFVLVEALASPFFASN